MTQIFEPPQPNWHLAEVNVARLIAPLDDPKIAPFAEALDRINGIAERMEGFMWRHTDASGNATETQIGGDAFLLFNTSVWRDVPSLERFVWGTVHAAFFKRRAEWFHLMKEMHFAMWWVAPGTVIAPDEAMDRLAHLDQNGPSARAFGWQNAPNATLWRQTQKLART